MVKQDVTSSKEKIIEFLKRGPSIPIRISKEIEQSTLFCSAFLSELLSEKKIKTSSMKVGSSPLYLIPGTEEKLEPYAENHLKGKEKEAFNLLKERKLLKDSEQEPAIRVALRSIKDFAKPLRKNEELYWRYFTAPEENLEKTTEKKPEEEKLQEPQKTPEQGEKNFESPIEKTKESQKEQKTEKKEKPQKTKKKTPKSSKADDKFFNLVKEYLNEKNIEIEDIVSVAKSELQFRIKKENEEKFLVAYNKKRITEQDITKAYKKAKELELKQMILSKGEPAKKTQNLIDAIKNLESLEKLEWGAKKAFRII